MAHGIAVDNDGTYTEYSSDGILPISIIAVKRFEMQVVNSPRSYTFTYSYVEEDDGIEFGVRYLFNPYVNSLSHSVSGRTITFNVSADAVPSAYNSSEYNLFLMVIIYRAG